jgi:hypothetical protein
MRVHWGELPYWETEEPKDLLDDAKIGCVLAWSFVQPRPMTIDSRDPDSGVH